MKHLTILTGPPGSGKSTYCKQLGNTIRISQDDQGKHGHMELFNKTLLTGEDIVVDRLNHTRDQRARYISIAKEHGYETSIVEFEAEYQKCFERLMKREGHPTIPKGDEKIAQSALDTYFNQYETILDREADRVHPAYPKNPVTLDLSWMLQDMYIGKFIIVGDVHGCLEDLMNVLKAANYEPSTDVVIGCGDLVDRGPDIPGVLDFFRFTPNVFTVRGNHDDKFIRYLRGNKVNRESLAESIRQTEAHPCFDTGEYYRWMMDLPYVITFGRYAITHAGFHPEYPTEHNSREFAMYARKYDPSIRTFTNDNTAPYWYTFPRKNDYMANMPEVIFFGHEVHEDFALVKKTATEEIYALDAGCYMGRKMRAAVIDLSENEVKIVEVPSTQPRLEKDNESTKWDNINKFEPYDRLVEQGYLNKQESGELVLYNYTDKCTFDKLWNKYTLESRGLILNKVTGDTVARPFPKFFNLSELGHNPKLPNESYECFAKEDGSLGILYKDPADNSWKIATRGSFQSEQAKKATDMFNNVPEYEMSSHAERWEQALEMNNPGTEYIKQWHDYTLLFEIIYPENRVSPGARLVTDYGSMETLILLGAIHKVSGKDMSYDQLLRVSGFIGLPLVKKFHYTIAEMIELQKTLPATQEGFVVKYSSGFRLKIKGHEYMKFHRLLNSISPIFMWELMKESPDFILSKEYLMTIPEEILPEVTVIESKLMGAFVDTMEEIKREYYTWKDEYNPNGELPEKVALKSLGLWSQNVNNNISHKSALFNYHKGDFDKVRKYAMLTVRPTSNVIKETI